MDTALIGAVVSATLLAGTPLILVALGLLINERSGVLNLGSEGMMAMGAVMAFIVAYTLRDPWLGVGAGMLAGMSVALIFGFLTISLQANQVASGLALAIFGVGLSAFVGKPYEAFVLQPVPPLAIPGLEHIPWFGEVFFQQSPIVYLSWVMFALVWWFLYRSRAGLVLRAVGEDPAAAHAIGHPVQRYRYLAVLFGGAMAGMGGAALSVFYTPLWSEGMVAGRGWIALALVVFATWRPLRILAGAYLFGGVMITQLFIQGSGLQIQIPAQFMSALPYLATIVVLVLISRNPAWIRLHSPASLGRPFRPES